MESPLSARDIRELERRLDRLDRIAVDEKLFARTVRNLEEDIRDLKNAQRTSTRFVLSTLTAVVIQLIAFIGFFATTVGGP